MLVNKHYSTLSPQYLLRFAHKIYLDFFFLPKKVTINISFPILHILYTLLLLLLSRFSRVRLCATPIDGSPPGSPIPGILQARTPEWVAISFSNAWKGKVKVKSLSRVRLWVTPWSSAYQAPPSMGFSRQEYWSGVPLPSPLYTLEAPNSFRVSNDQRKLVWNSSSA